MLNGVYLVRYMYILKMNHVRFMVSTFEHEFFDRGIVCPNSVFMQESFLSDNPITNGGGDMKKTHHPK